MPIELAKIKLERVHKLEALEQNDYIYHRIPGMAGDLAQNLGRSSIRILISGIFYGREARKSLEKLRKVYVKREKVDFVADIVGQYYVGKVIIDRLDVRETASEPDQLSYKLTISEYVEPSKSASAGSGSSARAGSGRIPGAAAVNKSVKALAKSLLDTAALPNTLRKGSLPKLTNPIKPLKGSLDSVSESGKALTKSMDAMKSLFGA